MIPEIPSQDECIESGPDCTGKTVYREGISATGTPFPRCDHHWSKRLELQERLNERYPEHPPADWSPLDAGESWYEDE